MAWNHGASAYRRGKCRCEVCTAANPEKQRRDTVRRRAAVAAGKIPDSIVHGLSTGRNWGCKCITCSEAVREANAALAERITRGEIRHRGKAPGISGCPCGECAPIANARNLADFIRRNDESRRSASRNGYLWTGPELEIATRPDLTAKQAAAMLGRTVAAVQRARQRCDEDPRYDVLRGQILADRRERS